MAGVLLLLGLAGLVIGLVAVVRGRIGWARIHSRPVGAAVIVAAVVLVSIGASLAPPPSPSTNTSAASATSSATFAPPTTTTSVETTPAATSAVAAPPPAAAGALRGLMEDVAWWNTHLRPLSAAGCQQQGETPLGTERSWSLPDGGIACYDEQGPVPWQGKIINVDVYFPRHVSEAAAIAVTAGLLPSDSTPGPVFPGVNNELSDIPDGTCSQRVYSSPRLAVAVHDTNPAWTDPLDKASLALYSGHASSDHGSDTVYRPGSINEVIVGIGPENRGADGVVHC